MFYPGRVLFHAIFLRAVAFSIVYSVLLVFDRGAGSIGQPAIPVCDHNGGS
jgi:hypothetical protein